MSAESVTIIIPTFNRAGWIGKAIASVLEQVRPGDRVLVVDDGSTDDTSTVVSHFGEPVVYHPVPHGGAGAARNAGVALADTELVAFLDSDDEWLPAKLELQRRLMRREPEVVMCFADYVGVDPVRGNTHHRMSGGGWSPATLGAPRPLREEIDGQEHTSSYHVGSGYLMLFRTGPLIQINTVVGRREAFAACPFPTDLSIYEEDECFARIAALGSVAYLDREVSTLCGHGEGRLSDVLGSLEAISARVSIMERVWGSDPAFLASHGPEFHRRLEQELEDRARTLLLSGAREAALLDIDRLGVVPLDLRIAAAAPPFVLRWALRARRMLKRRF